MRPAIATRRSQAAGRQTFLFPCPRFYANIRGNAGGCSAGHVITAMRFSIRLVFCLMSLLPPAMAAAAAPDLRLARAAFTDGLYSLARQQAEALLSKEDTAASTRLEAFDLILRSLERDNQLEALEKRLDNPPHPVDGQFPGRDYWRALLAFRRGDYEMARTIAAGAAGEKQEAALLLDTGRIEAQSLTALGKTNAALAVYAGLEQAGEAEPERWREINLEWAELLLHGGDPASCEERLAPGAADCPGKPIVAREWRMRVQALKQMGRDAGARDLLRRLADSEAADPVRGEAALHLAEALCREGHHQAAVEAARQARDLLADSPLAKAATLRLGMAMTNSEEFRQEGRQVLWQLADSEEAGEEAEIAQLALARNLHELGKHEEAEAAYRLFLEKFSGSRHKMQALWGRGWALLAQEQFADAAAAFRSALSLANDKEPWNTQIKIKLADALFADERTGEAAGLYLEVLQEESDPSLAVRAGLQAAECMLRDNRTTEAEKILSSTHERFSTLEEGIEAGLRLGRVLAEKGAASRALEIFGNIADRHQDNPEISSRAWLGRGRVLYRTFQFDKALADFERITNLATEQAAEAAFLRSLCLYWTGRDEQALRALDDFLETFPASPLRKNAVFWQGRYAYNRQRFDRARERFEHFASVWPEHEWADDALLWAARSAFAASEYGETLAIASRLLDTFPDSRKVADVRYLQGEALVMQARFEEAVMAFNEIVTRHPDSDWTIAAWGRKGDCLFTLGKDDPERYYEKSLHAYKVVTQYPDAPLDAVLQAAFKAGRTLEKMDRVDEALAYYYTEVIDRHRQAARQGIWHNEASNAWFARAVFQSADLQQERSEWESAIRILRHLAVSGVQGSREARDRIRRIEREHRWTIPARP